MTCGLLDALAVVFAVAIYQAVTFPYRLVVGRCEAVRPLPGNLAVGRPWFFARMAESRGSRFTCSFC